jgi:hypothetical protein
MLDFLFHFNFKFKERKNMISKLLISILCLVLHLSQIDSTCIKSIQVQLVIESENKVSSNSY